MFYDTGAVNQNNSNTTSYAISLATPKEMRPNFGLRTYAELSNEGCSLPQHMSKFLIHHGRMTINGPFGVTNNLLLLMRLFSIALARGMSISLSNILPDMWCESSQVNSTVIGA